MAAGRFWGPPGGAVYHWRRKKQKGMEWNGGGGRGGDWPAEMAMTNGQRGLSGWKPCGWLVACDWPALSVNALPCSQSQIRKLVHLRAGDLQRRD